LARGFRERDFIRNDAIDIETAPALRLCEASGGGRRGGRFFQSKEGFIDTKV